MQTQLYENGRGQILYDRLESPTDYHGDELDIVVQNTNP